MLNFFDELAIKISNAYIKSGWLKHNRTGLGIIALIFFFTTPFIALNMSLFERVALMIFLLFVGLLNSLPLFSSMYLSARNSQKEKELFNDKDFLKKMEKKEDGEKILC